jgi:hypothetical protein
MTASRIAEISKQLGELDNALVRQKNVIFDLINNGLYNHAEQNLEFVFDLWSACDYGYKYTELKNIIKQCRLMDYQNP